MRGFWLPIGLRAAAIFTCGLLLVGAGRYVKRHIHFQDHIEEARAEARAEARLAAVSAADAAAEAASNAVRASDMAVKAGVDAGLGGRVAQLGALASLAGVSRSKAVPPDFVFDGKRVGSLVRLKGAREARDTRARFTLVVRLEQGRQAAGCDLAPVRPDNFDLDAGFRCAGSGDASLVPVGSVTFEPGGATRAIKASTRMAEELATGDPFSIDADLTGPMSLLVNGKDGERVRLRSDSQGTALVVHDDQGRAVVRMQAGKDGFAIVVDTTGH